MRCPPSVRGWGKDAPLEQGGQQVEGQMGCHEGGGGAPSDALCRCVNLVEGGRQAPVEGGCRAGRYHLASFVCGQ